jgi:hypothetical protein
MKYSILANYDGFLSRLINTRMPKHPNKYPIEIV